MNDQQNRTEEKLDTIVEITNQQLKSHQEFMIEYDTDKREKHNVKALVEKSCNAHSEVTEKRYFFNLMINLIFLAHLSHRLM